MYYSAAEDSGESAGLLEAAVPTATAELALAGD